MKTVWILALDGVMDSSLAITLDVLRAAQSFAARSKAATPFEYRVLSSRAQLRTGCGLKLRSDGTFRQALSSDALPHWVVVHGVEGFDLFRRPGLERQALGVRKLLPRPVQDPHPIEIAW